MPTILGSTDEKVLRINISGKIATMDHLCNSCFYQSVIFDICAVTLPGEKLSEDKVLRCGAYEWNNILCFFCRYYYYDRDNLMEVANPKACIICLRHQPMVASMMKVGVTCLMFEMEGRNGRWKERWKERWTKQEVIERIAISKKEV